jgi:hypothetical protein
MYGGREASGDGMTTIFEDRERGFESSFQHDQELRFRARSRRAKLAGLWAAERLGLTGAPAEAYAKSVLDTDFGQADDGALLAKIRGDFRAKGIAISDHRIARELERLAEAARAQIIAS